LTKKGFLDNPMKQLILASVLLLSGCAAKQQLRCRFIAVDGQGAMLHSQTTKMHSHWHKGFRSCSTMIEALANGTVVETVTGDQPGVQVKGSKKERLRLKKHFDAEPGPSDRQGIAMVRKPSFPTIGEIAQ
jgi:hypothetical protein